MRGKTRLLTLLAALALLGGCGGHAPAPAPPDLRPAIAPPVKPIDTVPKHISIPSIGVDAAVEGIGLTPANQYELTPLDARPQNAGWYIYGPPPGKAGAALIMSHVNWFGHPGAFNHLDKVKVGDKITIGRGGGPSLTFTTTKVITWSKAKYTQLHVTDPTPDAQLRLVTCGGTYDAAHRNYLDNVWVFASLDKP